VKPPLQRYALLWVTLALPTMAVAAGSSVARQHLVERYCLDCHNTSDWAGGLALDTEDLVHVADDAKLWESVVRKVRAGMMPPGGEPRPPHKDLLAFSGGIEHELDDAAAARPVVAASGVRRLNRVQYGNAIRDLLDLEVDVTTSLPPDDVSHGFDNGETLGSSPALIEGYVAAAMRVSRRAVGDMTVPASQVEYRAPVGPSQRKHVEGLPLGTRGGLIVSHDFPLDAQYEVRIVGGRPPFGATADQREPRLQFLLDGQPQELRGGKARLKVAAGPHQLGAAVIDDERSAGVDDLFIGSSPRGSVQSIVLLGPYEPTGVGETPSRRAVFTCRPSVAAEEERCARSIIGRLAAHAFRLPALDDTAADGLMAFYRDGRARGGFETGIQQALARILVDPRFILRFEGPASMTAGTFSPTPDVALASRLSFLLWSSIPDESLLAAAERGELSRPRGLERQVRRMLTDPRAKALVEQFGEQWLQLRTLDSAQPDVRSFDDGLRQSLKLETRAFISSVILGDRGVLTLLDADYTFLDDRLAEHYGMAGVRGSYLRRVSLAPKDPRRGILGQGSILTLTSVANRTSPVSRGVWVLENIMGVSPPQPPANVNTNLDGQNFVTPQGPMPVRQRMELHRHNPACASCHRIMDPLGLALENFDLVGRWRVQEGGTPIDASGTLIDGRAIDGPASLRAAILAESGQFVSTFTQRLMSFALGRGVEYADMPAVRAIVRRAQRENYRFSALLLGVIESPQFLQRNVAAPAGPLPENVLAQDFRSR
jgi:Protein of unknown function (DUF1592)/Protein of unknown function (DUF1588)/Protein of unknown function (DUF1585)/Protein of unknown function (DUF1587)/Protein of unknown function (DUF1595)/Planctomycete cytochrome C